MQIIETNAVLDVPPVVAICPYCGGKLKVGFQGWTQRDDGTWEATSIDLDCVSEPEVEDNVYAYDEWLSAHTYMPYVYWLPVDKTVQKWISANYRFRMKD